MTGAALTSNVEPPLSDTATGGGVAEDIGPPGGDSVVDEFGANRHTAELTAPVPHAASAIGTARRNKVTAILTGATPITFL